MSSGTDTDLDATVVPLPDRGAAAAAPPRQPPDVLWPVKVVDGELSADRTGLQLLQTWVASKQWVHRRVETITFLDGHRLCRRVSVDLTVPEQAPSIQLRAGQTTRLLPLAIMRKRTLVNFDLHDGEGNALTLPSVRQNQLLTFTMLDAWARTVLDIQELHPKVREDLENIVCGTSGETEIAWGRLNPPYSDSPEDQQRRALMSRPKFQAVVKRMLYCFLLFVAVEAEPLTRLLVKYSYERPVKLYVTVPRGPLARLLGKRVMTFEFPQPSAEFAQSYHWEIEAPQGVEIVSATLRGSRWEERRNFLDERTAERRSDLDPDVRLDVAEEILRRIDLHTIDVPPGSRTRSVLKLSPERGGWLHLSTVIAWLSSLALLLAAPRLSDLMAAGPGGERRSDAIVLLFVTYALIMEALLIKPNEHSLATRLLKPFRRAAALCGLLPLVGSFLLVFWPEAGWQQRVWYALAVVGLSLALWQTFVIWLIGPSGSGSKWTADAWSRGRGIGKKRDLPPPRWSVLARIRWRLDGRDSSKPEAGESLLEAGKRNAEHDFYGGDVWNQPVHREIEQAIEQRLNRLT